MQLTETCYVIFRCNENGLRNECDLESGAVFFYLLSTWSLAQIIIQPEAAAQGRQTSGPDTETLYGY